MRQRQITMQQKRQYQQSAEKEGRFLHHLFEGLKNERAGQMGI